MTFEKIMVIGSEIPQPLNDIFQAATSRVTTSPTERWQYHAHNTRCSMRQYLISTGEEMDLAETVFNLRDISGSMELIIMSDQTDTIKSAVPKETLASLVSNATVMTMRELEKHLNLF